MGTEGNRSWRRLAPVACFTVVIGLAATSVPAAPPVFCPDGIDGVLCPPPRTIWGYYPTRWRRWPGTEALEARPELDVPVEVPEAEQELEMRAPQRGAPAGSPTGPSPAVPDDMPPVPPADVQSLLDRQAPARSARRGVRSIGAPAANGVRPANYQAAYQAAAERSAATSGMATDAWEGLSGDGWHPVPSDRPLPSSGRAAAGLENPLRQAGGDRIASTGHSPSQPNPLR